MCALWCQARSTRAWGSTTGCMHIQRVVGSTFWHHWWVACNRKGYFWSVKNQTLHCVCLPLRLAFLHIEHQLQFRASEAWPFDFHHSREPFVGGGHWVPRHWAVLISDLRQISPLGFTVKLLSGGARGLATCRHVPRETRVAVPYHTWRYPALLSRTPRLAWRATRIFRGCISRVCLEQNFHTGMKTWEAGAEPHAPWTLEWLSITI